MLKSIHKSFINLGIASLGAATMLLSQASASLAQTSVFLQGSFNDGGQILPGSFVTFNQFSNLNDPSNFQNTFGNILDWNINTTSGSQLDSFTYNPSSSSVTLLFTNADLTTSLGFGFFESFSSFEVGDIHKSITFAGVDLSVQEPGEVMGINFVEEHDEEVFSSSPPSVFIPRQRFGTVTFSDAPSLIVGSTQDNPIIPVVTNNIGVPPVFNFINVPSGAWFDPPVASGYTYTTTSDSLFSAILNFPTGFSDPFTVSANGVTLGTFSPGENLVFPNGGVSSFSITGITPATDPNNPNAFPLQLAFDTPTASFTQTIISSANTRVPEPSAMLGLGFVFCVGALSRKLKTA